MTHDDACSFPNCRDCDLQEDARLGEREDAAFRVATLPTVRINGVSYVDVDAAMKAIKYVFIQSGRNISPKKKVT